MMAGDFSIETLFKPRTIDAIRGATRGTCRLLDPKDTSPLTPDRALIDTDVALWRAIVLDIASWFFCVKRCASRPTAMVELGSDADRVTIELSDNCASWLIRGANDRAGGFYDPVRYQVRAWLKGTFPEYASPHRESMWRAGVIKQLQAGRRGRGSGT